MGKNNGKNISKNGVVNRAKTFLIMLNNLQQMNLKLIQKEYFNKTAEATGGLIGNKIAEMITKNFTTQ